ncbi:hypothetical protein EAVNVH72_03542 [Elizabethkingia anophelis]|uniref:hypothetical protein n=1 Tax=Elizabethkingia anophelis TaxID=1117645 RepID=UPI0020B75D4B|nr:hypothetical protein [Elizabethkingia anophelis]UTG65309.1 hypothetical protein J2O02_01815 [Elizabethkingia anophelis]CAH1152398.1 hypothetical protein EAVNVH72_02409 [Elizabethkingia anophelis]CAI9686945.1 hypothetical protein EAVNVH72_03542 [Elizabethkingia anophelis]
MSNLIEREFSLTEILVKTTYQIVVSKEPSFQSFPIAYGAGFFLNYKDNLFFITVDHNIHINDHKIDERTGIDNYVGILNNISDRNSLSTLITPIGGFYYMDSFDISKEDLNPQLVDVAISFVDRTKFEAPFLTDEDIKDENSKSLVSPNEQKMEFLDEHIVLPSEDDIYFIYGKIKPEIKGLFLHRTNTFKNELKYIDTYGDFILLNSKDEISSVEDWAGLSGSPVLNQKGQCIGVLCSVNEGTQSVFVKPFSKITPFLDTIILQEQIRIENENI